MLLLLWMPLYCINVLTEPSIRGLVVERTAYPVTPTYTLTHLPRVFVACATTDVGSPSPTDVEAETQNSYIWFSASPRAS